MGFDGFSELAARVAGTVAAPTVWIATLGDANLTVVDRAGFGSVTLLVSMPAGVTGTANLYLEESEDGTNFTAVPVDAIRGRAAGLAATPGLFGTLTAAINKLVQVGTTSKARYLRVRQGDSATPNGSGFIVALLGDPVRSPVSNTAW